MKAEAQRPAGRLAISLMMLCAGLVGCGPAKTETADAPAPDRKDEAAPALTASSAAQDETAAADAVAMPETESIAPVEPEVLVPQDEVVPQVAAVEAQVVREKDVVPAIQQGEGELSPVVEGAALSPDATAARTNTMPLAVPVSIRVDDAHWVGEKWTKRAPVSFDAVTDTNVTEYLVTIPLEYREGMRPDFGDVRFTLEDGSQTIRYALEEVVAGQTAKATVLVPTLSGGMPPLVFLYYGNSEADTKSDAKLLADRKADEPRPVAQVNLSTEREVKYAIIPPVEPPTSVAAGSHAATNEAVIPPAPPPAPGEARQE